MMPGCVATGAAAVAEHLSMPCPGPNYAAFPPGSEEADLLRIVRELEEAAHQRGYSEGSESEKKRVRRLRDDYHADLASVEDRADMAERRVRQLEQRVEAKR